MLYNGYNVILVLSSFLPLTKKNVVLVDYIINPIAFILSKFVFQFLATFEEYDSPISLSRVRAELNCYLLYLILLKCRKMSNFCDSPFFGKIYTLSIEDILQPFQPFAKIYEISSPVCHYQWNNHENYSIDYKGYNYIRCIFIHWSYTFIR